MIYNVIRQFINVDGSHLRVGDTIQCDENRAKVLKRNGLIGLTAEKMKYSTPEINITENAEEKPAKRQYRKRSKD